MRAMKRRQAEPEMWKQCRTRALWHLLRYLDGKTKTNHTEPQDKRSLGKVWICEPRTRVLTNHVPCMFCFKSQNIFFLALGQTVQRIAPECNESGQRVQRISTLSLCKEDKYAACVLYSLNTSSRTWIGNHDSHLATSVTYSMFIFRPVNTHRLFTRILGSHMITNDNIDILVARIKTRQAIYYNVTLRRVRVTNAAVEKQ